MDISGPTNLQKKFFSRNITARLAKSECVNSPTWWIPVGDRSSEKSYTNQSFPVNEVTCFLLKLAPNAASSCCSWREWWLWYRLELFFSFADIIGAAHLRQLVGWTQKLARQIWNEVGIRLHVDMPLIGGLRGGYGDQRALKTKALPLWVGTFWAGGISWQVERKLGCC